MATSDGLTLHLMMTLSLFISLLTGVASAREAASHVMSYSSEAETQRGSVVSRYETLGHCPNSHVQQALVLGEPCAPQLTVVQLPWPSNSSMAHVNQMTPTHISVQQCTGSCNRYGFSCIPTKASNRSIAVILSKCGIESGICDKECATIEIQDHEECECRCHLTHFDCRIDQRFEPELCSCQCKDILAKQRCLDSGRVWNDDACKCGCSHTTDCPRGQEFDFDNTCSCVPVGRTSIAGATMESDSDASTISRGSAKQSPEDDVSFFQTLVTDKIELLIIAVLVLIVLILLSIIFSLCMRIHRQDVKLRYYRRAADNNPTDQHDRMPGPDGKNMLTSRRGQQTRRGKDFGADGDDFGPERDILLESSDSGHSEDLGGSSSRASGSSCHSGGQGTSDNGTRNGRNAVGHGMRLNANSNFQTGGTNSLGLEMVGGCSSGGGNYAELLDCSTPSSGFYSELSGPHDRLFHVLPFYSGRGEVAQHPPTPQQQQHQQEGSQGHASSILPLHRDLSSPDEDCDPYYSGSAPPPPPPPPIMLSAQYQSQLATAGSPGSSFRPVGGLYSSFTRPTVSQESSAYHHLANLNPSRHQVLEMTPTLPRPMAFQATNLEDASQGSQLYQTAEAVRRNKKGLTDAAVTPMSSGPVVNLTCQNSIYSSPLLGHQSRSATLNRQQPQVNPLTQPYLTPRLSRPHESLPVIEQRAQQLSTRPNKLDILSKVAENGQASRNVLSEHNSPEDEVCGPKPPTRQDLPAIVDDLSDDEGGFLTAKRQTSVRGAKATSTTHDSSNNGGQPSKSEQCPSNLIGDGASKTGKTSNTGEGVTHAIDEAVRKLELSINNSDLVKDEQ